MLYSERLEGPKIAILLAETLGKHFLCVVRVVCLSLGEQKLGKGNYGKKERKKLSFPSGFSLPKREYQNNFSCLMNGEIFQAGSCTAQRELIL